MNQKEMLTLAETAASPEKKDSAETVRLRAMVDEHFDFIWRTVRRFGVPEPHADDAAQQVFMVASRKLSAIKIGSERAFLYQSAVRVAADVRRAQARALEPIDPTSIDDAHDTGSNPEELLDEAQTRALLDEVLDSIPMEFRRVFVLSELEELTMAEIAELEGAPPGTIASRLRRGRELFEHAAKRVRARLRNRGSS
jgi:RNA polymerase sigma-70 factor (ECF subfamily)